MDAADDRKTTAMSDLLRLYSCGRLTWPEDRAALLAGLLANDKTPDKRTCVNQLAHAVNLELVDHFADAMMVGADYNGALSCESENRAAGGSCDLALTLRTSLLSHASAKYGGARRTHLSP